MTSFYPSISTNDALQDYIDAFDPDLLAIFGFTEMIDMTSGAGYLSAEMFSLMVPLLLIIFAISLGASAIAGEEDKRTIEILLSEPVSRQRVFSKNTPSFSPLASCWPPWSGFHWPSAPSPLAWT